MSQTFKIISAAILSAAAITAIVVVNRREETILTIREKPGQAVRLPPPKTQGGMAVAEALANRRSVREFSERLLTQEGIAQLCWAAQGSQTRLPGSARLHPPAPSIPLLSSSLMRAALTNMNQRLMLCDRSLPGIRVWICIGPHTISALSVLHHFVW